MASQKAQRASKTTQPTGRDVLPEWMRSNRDAVHVPIRKSDNGQKSSSAKAEDG